MKGNRIANICAYVSLTISVVIILLWCCNVGGFTVVSLDSFVGVIVALLAIVVTFVIAWQIYNAVELNNRIRELTSLNGQITEQQHTLEQIYHFSGQQINYLYSSVAYNDGELKNAFRFLLLALAEALHVDNPMNIDIYLERMDVIVNKIVPNSKYQSILYDEIIESDKEIRSFDNYDFIRKRYEQLFNMFMSKVKRYEE